MSPQRVRQEWLYPLTPTLPFPAMMSLLTVRPSILSTILATDASPCLDPRQIIVASALQSVLEA